MLFYLSIDSKACINCHTMHSAYATWEKSSHKEATKCIDCHLPVGDFIAKYKVKAMDGWNHSVAFNLNTYKNNIHISEDGANRVQANCVRCHSSIDDTLKSNASNYHSGNKVLKMSVNVGSVTNMCHPEWVLKTFPLIRIDSFI